jgi:hypothetical protein
MVPGWTLPDPHSLTLEKNVVNAQAPFLGKTDVLRGHTGHKHPDPSRWPDPPHVFLANIGYANRIASVEEVEKFTRRYGPLSVDPGSSAPADSFEVYVASFGERQEKLRHAWRRQDAKSLWFPAGFENFEQFDLPLFWGDRGVVLRPADCWTYLSLLLTRDLTEDRARICENKTTCPTPFFVATRGNKKFCSWDCANVVTQRNFRKRRK